MRVGSKSVLLEYAGCRLTRTHQVSLALPSRSARAGKLAISSEIGIYRTVLVFLPPGTDLLSGACEIVLLFPQTVGAVVSYGSRTKCDRNYDSKEACMLE